jgi:PAS domain S-box-containing protein
MLLEQYKEAIENSNIVSKTDINGIITFVNDEFCDISGYTKEELIGKKHNIVKHPSIPKKEFQKLWSRITAKKTYKATVKNLSKSGKEYYVNTTITPILDENGNIEEYIAIRYDVTKEVELNMVLEKHEQILAERVKQQTKELEKLTHTLEKRVQEEIKKNEEKQKILFMQSRFASLGQMIANIAHQWRQPLTELNWVLFSLKNSSQKADYNKFETNYKEAQKIISNMSNTIEDFSNFFNPNKQKALFAIQDSINDALNILSKELKNEEITISKNFIDIQVEGISNELSQVIINLIQNAKDAFIINNIENRKIQITISKIEIQSKPFTQIDIEDNAGGINENYIDRVFEPYFSTKYASTGIGIGLFMSHMIIKNSLNGIIRVENMNGGAKFIITIPTQ